MSKRARIDGKDDISKISRSFGRDKEAKQHRARMDEGELLTLLFELFESPRGSPFWNLSELATRTDQPESFLKGVMEKICVHIRKGPHKNQYILKPEYRSVIVVNRMQAIEKDDRLNLLKKQGKFNEDYVEKDVNGNLVIKDIDTSVIDSLRSSSSSSGKSGPKKKKDDRARFIHEQPKVVSFTLADDLKEKIEADSEVKFIKTDDEDELGALYDNS